MNLWPKSKRARARLQIILAAGLALAVAVGLALSALRDSVVFFYGPAQIPSEARLGAREVRIGGLVKIGSVQHGANQAVRFIVTDGKAEVPVAYQGTLPDLFRPGQGVVAQGVFIPDGDFQAKTILAKHDERYMPREVQKALKDSGQWRGQP